MVKLFRKAFNGRLGLLKYLIVFICFASIPAYCSGDIDSFLTVKDSVYTVEYQFNTTCSEEKLLEVFYEFSHLENLINKKSTSLEKLDSGEDWYYVKYNYRYFLYKNTSIYRKVILPDENLVNFDVIYFEQNLDWVPEVLNSSGFYKIVKNDTNNTVIYFQETRLKGLCGKTYLDRVKKETEFFLKKLIAYVKGFEQIKEDN
ncbi:hypothetical protein JW879_07870 [candidate division WOR-3 bacterium]|nr:hypothetical protein [candidate division WOR-3 bacterium]